MRGGVVRYGDDQVFMDVDTIEPGPDPSRRCSRTPAARQARGL
jgi:hypothetical protein